MSAPWCLIFGHHWGPWVPLGYGGTRYTKVRMCKTCGKAIHA